MDLTRLKEPFAACDVEWRVQRCGKRNGNGDSVGWALVLCYITNRAIMDRLDEVVGPENWSNQYSSAPDGGILCGISINIDGKWITKFDGAPNTDIEPVKGGLSNAMKRAAVHWGIGRYLYRLDATFADVTASRPSGNSNRLFDKKVGLKGYWKAPELPSWALPGGSGAPSVKSVPRPAPKPVPKPTPEPMSEPEMESDPEFGPDDVGTVRFTAEEEFQNMGESPYEDAPEATAKPKQTFQFAGQEAWTDLDAMWSRLENTVDEAEFWGTVTRREWKGKIYSYDSYEAALGYYTAKLELAEEGNTAAMKSLKSIYFWLRIAKEVYGEINKQV